MRAEPGISPVIGIILMIALTVILLGIFAVVGLNLFGGENMDAEQVFVTAEAYNSKATPLAINIHGGPELSEMCGLRVEMDVDGTNYTGTTGKTSFSVGDKVLIGFDKPFDAGTYKINIVGTFKNKEEEVVLYMGPVTFGPGSGEGEKIGDGEVLLDMCTFRSNDGLELRFLDKTVYSKDDSDNPTINGKKITEWTLTAVNAKTGTPVGLGFDLSASSTPLPYSVWDVQDEYSHYAYSICPADVYAGEKIKGIYTAKDEDGKEYVSIRTVSIPKDNEYELMDFCSGHYTADRPSTDDLHADVFGGGISLEGDAVYLPLPYIPDNNGQNAYYMTRLHFRSLKIPAGVTEIQAFSITSSNNDITVTPDGNYKLANGVAWHYTLKIHYYTRSYVSLGGGDGYYHYIYHIADVPGAEKPSIPEADIKVEIKYKTEDNKVKTLTHTTKVIFQYKPAPTFTMPETSV